jgi:isopenicillin N synthase-like dioxygenase
MTELSPMPAHERRDAKRLPFSSIPVIDVAPLLGTPHTLDRMARAIDDACSNVGFFYICNHGVDPACVERAFAEARRFFALPYAEKMKIHYKKDGRISRVRGFVPLGELKAERHGTPDLQEGFDFSLELPADDPDYLAGNPMYGPNRWPEGLPAFRTAVYGHFEAMVALGTRLFRAFALALGLPADFFADKITRPLAQGRVIYYPPAPPEEGRWGIGAHCDYECFTILAQDEVGGLQVRNAAGEWIEAPPIPGAYIVNLGDMMARWTNDRYRSTPHRVLNRSGRARYSLVLFYGANHDTVIECLPTCREPGAPPRYAPVTQGAWTERQLADAYFF